MSRRILPPMSDTARSYQTNQPSSTDGLDDFFASEELKAIPREEPGIACSAVKASTWDDQASPDGVPVDQAAKLLGISANAVVKRLNKGKLSGFKVAGQFGQKWMVNRSDLPAEAIQIEFDSSEAMPQDSEEQPGSAQGTAGPEQALPGTASSIASDSLKIFAQVIKSQTAQIEAQNDLIRHLTSELKDRDTQVKLLTDSQQKQGWWVRFLSWFLGTR